MHFHPFSKVILFKQSLTNEFIIFNSFCLFFEFLLCLKKKRTKIFFNVFRGVKGGKFSLFSFFATNMVGKNALISILIYGFFFIFRFFLQFIGSEIFSCEIVLSFSKP